MNKIKQLSTMAKAAIVNKINELIRFTNEKHMEQFIITYVTGQDRYLAHNGKRLTFTEVKEAIENPNYFVYLNYANALHIPCFIVDSTGLDAVGFTAAFSINDEPHIERIAINENNEINTHNYTLSVAADYNIQASQNITHEGYSIPKLTSSQVTKAYNSLVSGHPITITDATGNYHLSVMQADALDGEPSISVIYLNVMLITYTVNGRNVDIQSKML